MFVWANVGYAMEASMAVKLSFAAYNGQALAVLEMTLPDGYYAYAPGNSQGKPVVIRLHSPMGSHQVWYTAGERKNAIAPDKQRVYRRSAYAFVALDKANLGTQIHGEVDALLCSAAHCLPQRISFHEVLPAQLLKAEEQAWFPHWEKVSLHPPRTLSVSPAAEQTLAQDLGDLLSAMPIMKIPSATGAALADLSSPVVSLPPLLPRHVDASLEVSGMGKALLLGFLAGLLLNIMPCVLPVLTLKVSGLLLAAQGNDEERRRQFREHNIFFAAGVMTWFTLLALVLGMAGLMWGQLFQHQEVILAMLLVVFLLGLSMLGVFTLPMIDLKHGTSGNPKTQAFTTGMLATLLATPCSGPLLGGVLSWAFTQPVSTLVVVFCAVGMGMSFPYILFAFHPEMVRLLPRPGAWMGIVEKMMGFFLLGTALYLLSILPPEQHMRILTGLLLVALCAWLWGHFCGYTAPPRRRLFGRLAGATLLAGALWYAAQPPHPELSWQPFTTTEFSSMLGKRPMLVEFTADWCPNCKFLEASVLNDQRMRAAQERYGMLLMRADLTHEDAEAKKLLEMLGAHSIPVTALFPAGENSVRPFVLRDVYSSSTLDEALQRAFSSE